MSSSKRNLVIILAVLAVLSLAAALSLRGCQPRGHVRWQEETAGAAPDSASAAAPQPTPEPISEATLAKIRIGMSKAELHYLLGPSTVVVAELGIVLGPDQYSGPFEPGTREGLQNYVREQWNSPDFVIIVISDRDGRVACKYAGLSATGKGGKVPTKRAQK